MNYNQSKMTMKVITVLLYFLSIFSLNASGQADSSQSGKWMVGFAETDITPLPGVQVQMAGYGVERYARGTYKPLKSQAVALRDAHGNTAVFIANDVIAFDRVFVNAVRKTLKEKYGIPEANIMLVASHTHWGPKVAIDGVFSTGSPNVWYTGWLEDRIVETAGRALSDLSPASIRYTSFDFREIACNRRLPVDGEILMRPNPAGSFDGQTPVIDIKRAAMPRQILMVGYSSHVTGSGGIQMWSPGYPGAMRDYIDSKLPGTRAVFIQGVGGDAKICYKDPETGKAVFSSDTIHSREAGEKLAKAVIEHLRTDRFTNLSSELKCAISRGSLSFGTPWPREEIDSVAYTEQRNYLTWSARQALVYPYTGEKFPYEVQVWEWGDALTIFGMEDEVCSPWGKVLRGMSRTPLSMVAGYANNTTCYIPDARMIEEGGYESVRSQKYRMPAPFSKNIDTEIKAIVERALDELN